MKSLPVTTILEELATALENHSGAILQAPPGAGKTTLVPLALFDRPWLGSRRIILLEPRRLAARAAALRMADLLGEPVGRTVGYRMRMERRVSPATRIEVVTEGILTRKLQSDPALADVGLVVFDEFHERSLQADLGLTLCLDIQGALNENLRLLVMSATLPTERLAAFMGHVPVISCGGRTHPVATRYGNVRQRQGLEKRVADKVRQAVIADDASILVFLPGAAEIRRVARRLQAIDLGKPWRIMPLYGRLSREAQDHAIQPATGGRRKIVLATSIAETSLTIEGIRVVIDSGFMRVPRFDLNSGLTRLVTLPVTRASADQRRGRAGRTAPGVCYRLWSQTEHNALVPEDHPEIRVSDMAALALELARWGVRSPDHLRWLDAPPHAAYEEACELLRDLGAVDERGRITSHGREMTRLSVHPRLAHMLLRARDHGLGRMACDLAAILSEPDFMRYRPDAPDVDLQRRMDGLEAIRGHRDQRLSAGDVNRAAARRIIQTAQLLRRRIGQPRERRDTAALGRLLAWAYPERIAQRRSGGEGRYLLANGRGAYLDAFDPLAAHAYLVAAELDGNRRDARIFLAAAYDRDTLIDQYADRLETRDQVVWAPRPKRVAAVRQNCLGALVVSTERLARPDPGAVQSALLAGIRVQGLECLPWSPKLRIWQKRVSFLHRTMGPDWPDLSDTHLVDTLERWLAPFIAGMTQLRELQAVDLGRILRGKLNWRQQKALERLAPAALKVPSGRMIPVDYGADPPVMAVRLQEMFGLMKTPVLADGRQPVVVHMLSPAGRPVQITQDLAGFWQKGYNEVRKQLRGRYPKHYWPEDPLTARATHRVRPWKR